ncbi:MAG: putative OB-fold protein [Candidatus Binatia bacterium]|jgi:uncharacterized OB-fold protein
MSQAQGAGSVLTSTHVIEYPYTRSVGPALGRFLAGLRDGRIIGSRTPSGQVYVPPLEFDPDTAATVEEYVEVADQGVVTSWTWVPEPRAVHPMDRPFAFALIRLDGADHALMHVIDVPSADQLTTGMRVKARWAQKREGAIGDIVCFEPV